MAEVVNDFMAKLPQQIDQALDSAIDAVKTVQKEVPLWAQISVAGVVVPTAAFALWLNLYGTPGELGKMSRSIGREKWKKPKDEEDSIFENDVIVVGAGSAGLHTASILARAGKKVLVLERHELVGGGAHEFDLAGKSGQTYTFDSGLHYTIPVSQQILHMAAGSI